MFVIAGLGNPGERYEITRHNSGFLAVEHLKEELGGKPYKLKHKAQVSECQIGAEKVLLVRPQTFMNLSGESIREVLSFYKLTPENLIVIYDDIDLPVGKLRVRPKGGAGTHNGMKSVISCLGTENFPRVRIGVGSPQNPQMDLADYILSVFLKEEQPVMSQTVKKAGLAARDIILMGTERAMAVYNKDE
jgi:PTH1 family peptidyl-tRNA hydrolase